MEYVVGFIFAVIGGLIAKDIDRRLPLICNQIARLASSWIRGPDSGRYREEWLGHLDDLDTRTAIFITTLGFAIAAIKMRLEADMRVFQSIVINKFLPRLIEFQTAAIISQLNRISRFANEDEAHLHQFLNVSEDDDLKFAAKEMIDAISEARILFSRHKKAALRLCSLCRILRQISGPVVSWKLAFECCFLMMELYRRGLISRSILWRAQLTSFFTRNHRTGFDVSAP